MTGPRVLQVVLSLDPGGTERLVLELVQRLHRDMPMAVCCLDRTGTWGDELAASGISVTALGRRPGFHPSLGRGVARVARAHAATVIHAHHYTPFVYAALARLWNGPSSVIFTEHGRLSDAGPSARRRAANRVLAHGASRVFTVSGELGDHLAHEGIPRHRIEVIYNGIDLGPRTTDLARQVARTQLGVSEQEVLIGTIARLDPVKDLGTLITALGILRHTTPARLLIVGDGDERAHLERTVETAGLRDVVQFLGRRDDARSWLAACDVYVNCSTSEGVSLTILEAMAAGLPVVATAVGGTPEIVDDSHGRLVPARSAQALASAVGALAQDADLRRRMGSRGRAKVEDRFRIERMVSDYAGVYRDVGRHPERDEP